MEGEGSRKGDVERANSWGGAAIHELASHLYIGARRPNNTVRFITLLRAL